MNRRAAFNRPREELTAFAQSNRANPSSAEALLWERLQGHQLGCKVRRQHVLMGYIADFYVPAHRLAIEIDGAAHDNACAKAYDQRRDQWLGEHGYSVLRFTNAQVLTNLALVVDTIRATRDRLSDHSERGEPPAP